MSNVQTTPTKEVSKIETPLKNDLVNNSKSAIIQLMQAEEVKPQKSVLEIAKSVNNLQGLLKNYDDFSARLQEINQFKNLLADGSGCNLVITHSSGKTIQFAQLDSIHDFINTSLEKGDKAFEVLEHKIQQATL